jgi:hypothetical protein
MLLLYCMAEAKADAPMPSRGVRGAAVEVLPHGPLACYLSRYESFPGGTAEELKQDALDFHWTINHVFEKQAVIPFRFPTLLPMDSDLMAFLHKNSTAYAADLQRLRDQVQMEVRFMLPADTPASGTGTAYLKAKFDAAQRATELENLVRSAVQADWRQRNHRHFALIPRGAIAEFRDKIADLGRAALRVSGPWPPTEFVNCYPEVSLSKDQENA